MKKVIALTLALVLCLSLCSCSKENSGTREDSPDDSPVEELTSEERGVPDEIVLDEYEGRFNRAVDYTISHNVNTETHIDHVTATLTYDEEYAVVTDTLECKYQYDRSSDLWTLLDHSWLASAPDLKEEKFVGQWEDDGGAYYGVKTICIYEIDDNYVRFSYQAGEDNRKLTFNLPLEYNEYYGWHVVIQEEDYFYYNWSDSYDNLYDELILAPYGLDDRLHYNNLFTLYTYVGPID